MANLVCLSGESTKLSRTVTVAQYRTLAQSGNRERLSSFIEERFDERYFRPLEQSCSKHGFTIMAVGCLVIEALESFYQGLEDARGKSKKMFRDFFRRDSALKIFGGGDDWFYHDIRCGILHQAVRAQKQMAVLARMKRLIQGP